MAEEVFRITNYGGERTNSARGGRAVEYFACVDINPDNIEKAHLLGLPNVGEFHISPSLGFVGTVQRVSQVRELPPSLWIARVEYSTGGTFNFNVRVGATSDMLVEKVPIPVVIGAPGSYAAALPPHKIDRYSFRVAETTRFNGNMTIINNVVAQNIGRLYYRTSSRWEPLTSPDDAPDTIWYQLAGIRSATDIGGTTRIETYFVHKHGLKGMPAGTAPNFGTVDIPPLPSNGEYSVNVRDGIITAAGPLDNFEFGGDLYWQ